MRSRRQPGEETAVVSDLCGSRRRFHTAVSAGRPPGSSSAPARPRARWKPLAYLFPIISLGALRVLSRHGCYRVFKQRPGRSMSVPQPHRSFIQPCQHPAAAGDDQSKKGFLWSPLAFLLVRSHAAANTNRSWKGQRASYRCRKRGGRPIAVISHGSLAADLALSDGTSPLSACDRGPSRSYRRWIGLPGRISSHATSITQHNSSAKTACNQQDLASR